MSNHLTYFAATLGIRVTTINGVRYIPHWVNLKYVDICYFNGLSNGTG